MTVREKKSDSSAVLKLMERALREAEDKFIKAVNVSVNAICIISLPEGRFVEINEGYTRFSGYTLDEVIGRTAAELNLFVDSKELQTLLTLFRKDGKFRNREFHSRMKSGKIRKWLFSAVQISVNGEPCLIAMSIDITERKMTEEKIRKQNEFLNTILESITHPFYVINTSDYSITAANSATNAGDLLKKPTCHAVTHKNDRPCHDPDNICPLEEMKLTKRSMVVEHLH